MRSQVQIYIERPPDIVFAFLIDPKNHARLGPEAQEETWDADRELAEGVRVRVSGGLWRPRTLLLESFEAPHGFTATQVEGPYHSWSRTVRLLPFQLGTLWTDQYAVQNAGIDALTERFGARSRIDDWARHRQTEAKRLLERIGRILGPGR
jgi:ligand-binding SRPBCC domain-containing protein